MLDQRRRRWPTLYKCYTNVFVFAGKSLPRKQETLINIGLKLPNRLRRRASIISTLVQLLVFVGYTRTRQTVMEKSVSMDIIHVDIILLSQEWIEKILSHIFFFYLK